VTTTAPQSACTPSTARRAVNTRSGFCPSCGARRMAQTAAHLLDHVIPHVPVRQWVHSLPIPLRLLLAAQPKLVTLVLQVVHRVITRHLLGQAGLKAQAAACTYCIAFGPRAGQKVLTVQGAMPRDADFKQHLCADIDGFS